MSAPDKNGPADAEFSSEGGHPDARAAAGSAGSQRSGFRWEAPGAGVFRDVFPGLRVLELAGKGGMGAVYRAEQLRLGRYVAVKVLPPQAAPDKETRERFEREARILSGLNHPHILQLHDFGSLADGTLYLVTEWADRGDLAALIGQESHPPSEVRVWVKQISQALDAAHARGIVHRDLKPGNVLVLADGRLTLADFGLAHSLAGGLMAGITVPGHVYGTFEYMAPEQMEREPRITPACDIYALGVMTYQMLTGRVPRGAYPRPSRLASVPTEVDAFLDLAMASDPERRPRSGAEFSQLFDRACRSPQLRRQRQLVGLGAVLVALALAWARSEIISSEREAAAAEAREAALVNEARLADARRAMQAALRAAEQATTEGGAPIVAAAGGLISPRSWMAVLATLDPGAHARSGDWSMDGEELSSGGGRCVLSLPVKPAASYDLEIEFTRLQGQGPLAIFLPTLAGVGVLAFESPAGGEGIAVLQVIEDPEKAPQDRQFFARIESGRRHRVLVQVRGWRVSVEWEGRPRMSWDLTGTGLVLPSKWETLPDVGLGIGTLSSPTTFHRIEHRVLSVDPAP
jgi:hypothetical protein